MAFNDHSEYPDVVASGTISTSADIGTNGVGLKVAWIKVSNTTGATAVLTVTGHGGTTTKINYSVDIPDEGEWNAGPFYSHDGLRLASAAALGYMVTQDRSATP